MRSEPLQLRNIPPADPSAGPQRELDRLTQHVHQLESLQTEMVRNELERLNELTTLMRIADALSHRRPFDAVLDDALEEVGRIARGLEAWIVVGTSDGPIGRVHRLPACDDDATAPLPHVAQALCQRLHDTRPSQIMATADGDAGERFLGMPIFTSQHLLGVLVIRDDRGGLLDDENRIRLIQSVLRQAAMAAENDRLINALNHMIVEVVCAFSLAIESRDAYTGGHVQRVTAYAVALARRVGMDERQQSIVRLGGLLHDIGKVAIPDAILNKPGKLTNEEFAIIRTHPVVGHQIIGQIPQLHCVDGIIRHHHERWDGKGYPDGLAGRNIPLLARILAIADTFDAMTSSRSYRSALSFEQAMQEIHQCAGTQFDAELAASFVLFDRDELLDDVAQLQRWCRSPDDRSTSSLIDLIDLDLPAMSACRI